MGSESSQSQEYVKVGSKSQSWDLRLAGRALVSGSLVPWGPSGMASSQDFLQPSMSQLQIKGPWRGPGEFLHSKEFSNTTLTVSHSREKRKWGESVSHKKYGCLQLKKMYRKRWVAILLSEALIWCQYLGLAPDPVTPHLHCYLHLCLDALPTGGCKLFHPL